MKTRKSCILMPLIAVFLYACGSGGGGTTTPNNQGSSITDTTYSINGAVQKGPFVTGTTITIRNWTRI